MVVVVLKEDAEDDEGVVDQDVGGMVTLAEVDHSQGDKDCRSDLVVADVLHTDDQVVVDQVPRVTFAEDKQDEAV